MAPILKRKGGPADTAHTPKRVKSATEVVKRNASASPPPSRLTTILSESAKPSAVDLSKTGWDAAFGFSEAGRELATTNATHGAASNPDVEGMDYEEANEQARQDSVVASWKHRGIEGDALTGTSWKVADSVGGRLVDLDPVFVGDEQYVVVALKQSLKIYSTTNSLLHRIITLAVPSNVSAGSEIIAFTPSATNPNAIWVAHSAGLVYCVDWTSGTGSEDYWTTSSKSAVYMTAAAVDFAGETRDVVYTTEKREEGGWRIQAHELVATGQSSAKTIYTSTEEIQLLQASSDGHIIVASSGSRILVGHLRSTDFSALDRIKYLFRVFESSDEIFSFDIRVTERVSAKGKKQKLPKIPVVDVAVGDVKGSIFVHSDLLQNLVSSETPVAEGSAAISLLPRKLHWHRKCVQAVKWSRDGNYLISGGSENVMVLWQLDTGRHTFLPNLATCIQNIVVSPAGSSYAVHLADNSTMILSTAELVPTASFSGLQAHVLKMKSTLESRVKRVTEERSQRPLMERTPALINPLNPSQLLLAVGDIQEIDPVYALKSSVPYLQTFDISTSHNVSRQALTRTNVTGRNIAPNAHRIDEARVAHMQVSHNGKWLATVDEWLPPRRDISFLRHGGMDLIEEQRRRREVYLKFWKWNEPGQKWELVSRIDAPHSISSETYGAGQVLSLVADPTSLAFSTIGEDSVVRVWRPRNRKRDNIQLKTGEGELLVDWKCQRLVSLGKPDLVESESVTTAVHERPEHGSLAYSEDGSILAAALSNTEDNVIHLLDPSTGSIRSSRPGLYRGSLISLGFLSRYLITLADRLQVHDLVAETLKYEIALGNFRTLMSLEQKTHMMHLAIDPLSTTFAVALPTSTVSADWLQKQAGERRFLDAAQTEIAIFSPEDGTPLITHTLPAFATALLPAIGNPGFIVLDAAAEVTPITPKTVQTITSTAQPIVDQQLELAEDEIAERGLADLIEDADDEEEDDEEAMDVDMDAEDANDDGPRVVSQQALTQIFDNGPAFAMPPIEEMFYQVCELFSSKAMIV